MDSDTGLHDSGKHLLGSHVIGQRIVVRRLLRGQTGPTGGPAFRDLLGVCVAWGDGVCEVQPASGPAVQIPIGDIVSGKPVPPRPSVRHRVSDRAAEEHALALWPQIERADLGDWVMRSDPAPVGRALKRANSTLAIGDPGASLDEAAAQVIAFYVERARTPMVQVTDEHGPWFREAGWEPVPGGDSHFQLGSLSRVARALGRTAPAELRVDGNQAVVEVRVDDQVVAVGRAGLSRDWLGIHALTVEPSYRRQGLARRALGELVGWGGEQGAGTVWLHVETDNVPALELYESLGLRTHHSLSYLTAPSGDRP